ncbi:MAG TPA: hypothetical protein EYG73_06370 [Arcobacter sp.]|nr:hypothetical protein [Arcobacter sp.]
MALNVKTISYRKDDEEFECNDVRIISRNFHQEEGGGYKEPNDDVEVIKFEVVTEDGRISGEASARRSGFGTDFEYEDNVELSIDNDDETIELLGAECIVEEDEED